MVAQDIDIEEEKSTTDDYDLDGNSSSSEILEVSEDGVIDLCQGEPDPDLDPAKPESFSRLQPCFLEHASEEDADNENSEDEENSVSLHRNLPSATASADNSSSSTILTDNRNPSIASSNEGSSPPIMRKSRTNTALDPNSPARNHTHHTVTFSLADGEPRAALSSLSHEELEMRVEQLQQKLTQTLIDLSGERAWRRRKERNLIKLAKELQKRTADMQRRNKMFVKMAQTLNDAEAELKGLKESHAREMKLTLQRFRVECRTHEQEVKQTQDHHGRVVVKLQQELDEMKAENEILTATVDELREVKIENEHLIAEIRELSNDKADNDKVIAKPKELGDVGADSEHLMVDTEELGVGKAENEALIAMIKELETVKTENRNLLERIRVIENESIFGQVRDVEAKGSDVDEETDTQTPGVGVASETEENQPVASWSLHRYLVATTFFVAMLALVLNPYFSSESMVQDAVMLTKSSSDNKPWWAIGLDNMFEGKARSRLHWSGDEITAVYRESDGTNKVSTWAVQNSCVKVCDTGIYLNDKNGGGTVAMQSPWTLHRA